MQTNCADASATIFAGQCGATTFDHGEAGIDFIGAIDVDRNIAHGVQIKQRDADRAQHARSGLDAATAPGICSFMAPSGDANSATVLPLPTPRMAPGTTYFSCSLRGGDGLRVFGAGRWRGSSCHGVFDEGVICRQRSKLSVLRASRKRYAGTRRLKSVYRPPPRSRRTGTGRATARSRSGKRHAGLLMRQDPRTRRKDPFWIT